MDFSHEKYQRLVEKTKAIPSVTTAVAHPCDESPLRGVVDAVAIGVIDPPIRSSSPVTIPAWASSAQTATSGV